MIHFKTPLSIAALIVASLLLGNAIAQTPTPAPVIPSTTLEAASSAKSAVVATVNGEQITAAQLDYAAAPRLRGVSDPEQIKQVKAFALNELINQTLVLQVSEKTGKAATPEQAAQIEQLRKQALVGYYLSNQVGELSPVKEQAVDDFIRKHPEMLDQHKTFHYNEVIFPSSEQVSVANIQPIINKDGGLKDIKEFLRVHKVGFVSTNLWRGSEQIPAQTLSWLQGLKPGAIKVTLLSDQKNIQVLKLVDVYPDPVAIEDARIPIIRGIQKDMQDQAVQQAIANLASKAQINIADPEMAKAVAKVITPMAPTAPATFVVQIRTAWYFAALLLLPFACVLFYKQVKPKAVEKVAVNAEFATAQPLFKLSPYAVRIPALLLFSYWLLTPMVDFFSSPPMWVTVQKMAFLALSGIGVAIVLIVIAWKVPVVGRYLKKGWLALLVLALLRLAFGLV